MSTEDKLTDLLNRMIRVESKLTVVAGHLGVDPSAGRSIHLANDDVFIETMAVSFHDIEKHVKSTPRWATLAKGMRHDFCVFLGSPGNCTYIGDVFINKS
jgi:hypothetical protein